MNSNHKQALQYVRNTNGGATRQHFFEDHDPIGELLWNEIYSLDYVIADAAGRIRLTDTGVQALDEVQS